MPFGNGRFGPTILGITNASPCVVTVDSPLPLIAGTSVRISAVADNQTGPSLNGDYSIISITGNQITLNADTTLNALYISGGFMVALDQVVTIPAIADVPYIWTNLARNNTGYIPVGDVPPPA